MFGCGAAGDFFTRSISQAALLLVDIADCNVRVLARLNELIAERKEAPAETLPK